jgi:hypothetical protein
MCDANLKAPIVEKDSHPSWDGETTPIALNGQIDCTGRSARDGIRALKQRTNKPASG